jgi:hypothetical protein
MFNHIASVALPRIDFSSATAFWLFMSAKPASTRGTSMPIICADPQPGTFIGGNRANSVCMESYESYASLANTHAVTSHIRQKAKCVHFGMRTLYFASLLDFFFGAFLCGFGGVASIRRSTSSSVGDVGLGIGCFMAGV